MALGWIMILACDQANASFENPGGTNFSAAKIATSLNASAYPAYSLKGGQAVITLSPAYLIYKSEEGENYHFGDVTGYGGAISTTYGLNSHVGIGAIASYLKMQGTSSDAVELAPSTDPRSAGTLSGFVIRHGDVQSEGGYGSVLLILDPFSEPEGFRLPIMLGINYYNMNQTENISGLTTDRNGSNTSYGSLNVTKSIRGFGWALGLSAQFNLGQKLRLAPFLLASRIPDTQEKCVSSGNGNCPQQSNVQGNNQGTTEGKEIVKNTSNVPTLGIQVTLRNWDFSLMLIPPVLEGLTNVSINFHLTFN